MEEYTEKQVLEQVEKDLSGGVFSHEMHIYEKRPSYEGYGTLIGGYNSILSSCA